MNSITVVLDDHMNAQGNERIIQAIEMIKGVKYVTQTQGTPSSAHEHPPINRVQPSATSSEPIKAVFDDPSSSVPPTAEQFVDNNQQQYFINEVIRWAVKNRMLNMAEVQNWSPEQIVTNAFKLFEAMPEDLQKEIGQSVAGM